MNRSHMARARYRRRRRGFTIVEVIVSIMVMVVGVLGLASTGAVVQRLIGAGAQQTMAANIAQTRFEKARSLDCNLLSSGSLTRSGLSERWQVVTVGPRVRLVTDSVIFTSGRRKPQVYVSLVQC
jgi:prepilin-type N-terminal cleavage/methylation domain-containing protein